MLQPGMKVAHQMPTDPHLLVLGKVTADGRSVVWQEVVDHNGTASNHFGQGVRPNNPVPVKGDEQPCPPQFAHLVK